HRNLNPKNILVYNDRLMITGFEFSISLDRLDEYFETLDYLEYLDSESIVYSDPALLSTY
ncbi:3665_t:CDS:2, partial [Acaulospora morrowiae]